MNLDGYKSVIVGGDPCDNATDKDKVEIQEKCLFLIFALRVALNKYPHKKWTQACDESSKFCKTFGYSAMERTIRNWWCEFRKHDGFSHPRGQQALTTPFKQYLPPFLRNHQDLTNKFNKFCLSPLSNLNIAQVAKDYRYGLVGCRCASGSYVDLGIVP